MGKHKVGITFDKNLLYQLKENRCSCVEVRQNTQHLALHPCQLENLNNSIKDTLNKRIARYNKQLEGILLGYQKIKLIGDTGAINFDSCFIHIDIQAEFYIFKPNVGEELSGVVNKKSTDHVGVLVYNTFNVSLPKPSDTEDWLGDGAQIGHEVRFKILFTDLELRLPYIRGELISIVDTDSGISTSEETAVEMGKKRQNKVKKLEISSIDSSKASKRKSETLLQETPKKKKRKHSRSVSESEGLDTSNLSVKKKSKKDKNYNIDELRDSLIQQQVNLFVNPKKSKGKKIKHEKNKEDLLLVQDNKISNKRKKKKKDKKVKREKSKDEDDISLPDLNLNELFSSDFSQSMVKVDMADHKDKKTRKRLNSMSQVSSSFNLPNDSDLDDILNTDEKRKLKRKRSLSESHSTSKRKKKNSVTE